VKTWKRIVQEAQEKADTEALSRPVTLGDSGLPPAELARRNKIQQAKTAIDILDRQIAARQAEDARLRKVALDLQSRIDAAPVRESEMTEMNRDYGTLTQLYTSFLGKREDAQIATNLERRQIGETFKLIDPARLPERPSSPDRPRINMLGMVAGVGLGLALIALLEYRDATFKTDEEITAHLSFPVLAVVPLMESEIDKRRARKRKWITGVALGSTVAGCMAVLIYTFVR
jgi:hypothetical protein